MGPPDPLAPSCDAILPISSRRPARRDATPWGELCRVLITRQKKGAPLSIFLAFKNTFTFNMEGQRLEVQVNLAVDTGKVTRENC